MFPKRRHRNKGRRPDLPQLEFPDHRKFVRGHECLIAGKNGHVCSDRFEAAHFDGPIPNIDRGGKSKKDHDKWTFCLCALAHAEYHNLGYARFEAKYGVDTMKAAQEMARLSPHRKKWEEAA